MAENPLQSLSDSEAMLLGDVNDDDIAAMSSKEREEEEQIDTEFLNEYESTFNIIDSELDALRHSITDTEDSKVSAIDEASNSLVSDESLEMPAIDDVSLGMERYVKEDEIEIERDAVLDPAIPPSNSSNIIERPVEVPQQIRVPKIAAQEKGTTDLHPQVKLKPSSKIQPKQVDTAKKPSQAFNHLAALFLIALSFLTGQRVPIQGSGLVSPISFDFSSPRIEKMQKTEEVTSNDLWCKREYDFSAIFDDSEEVASTLAPYETQEIHVEAVHSLQSIFNDTEEVASTIVHYESPIVEAVAGAVKNEIFYFEDVTYIPMHIVAVEILEYQEFVIDDLDIEDFWDDLPQMRFSTNQYMQTSNHCR